MKKKIRKFDFIIISIVCVFLILYSFTLIYALGWGALTSLKSRLDVSPSGANNILGFPILSALNPYNSRKEFFQFWNYRRVYELLDITTYAAYYQNGNRVLYDMFGNSLINIKTSLFQCVINTILYCGISVTAKVLVTGVTAYVVVKYKFKFSKVLYMVILIAMTVPIVGSQPSELDLLRNLGIYSTWFQCLIQASNFSGFYFFVFYAFFVGMSDSYIEAAEIDGASQFTCLVKVVIPLASKTFLSVALLLFISYWNQYENVLIYMPRHPTLAYAVYDTVNKSNGGLQDITTRTAACMMLAIPILILFIVFHKHLMGNISLGGLKE